MLNINENIKLTFDIFIKRMNTSCRVFNKRKRIYENFFKYKVEVNNCQNYGKAWIWALENLPHFRTKGRRWRVPVSTVIPVRRTYFFENLEDSTLFKLKWA
jgi:hypothetical protein